MGIVPVTNLFPFQSPGSGSISRLQPRSQTTPIGTSTNHVLPCCLKAPDPLLMKAPVVFRSQRIESLDQGLTLAYGHIPQMAVADRFTEYVAELHELSDSHRLPHGNPEDLVRLLEAFQNSQIFATDFGCAMRSIVLREHFKASETELLTLVAVAWAGKEPDESTPQLSYVIQEVRGILHKSLAQKVLTRRTIGPASTSAEGSEEAPDVPSDLPDTTRDSSEMQPSTAVDSAAIRRDAPAQDSKPSSPVGTLRDPEPAHSGQDVPPHQPRERRVAGKKDRRKSLDYPFTFGLSTTTEISPPRRLEPSAAEIVAMGLVGLMAALLFSVASLPIYRARVSVYLPSTVAAATDPGTNASSSSPAALHSGSRGESLLNGELTEKVSQRLLARPHTEPILRQDVVSRGMRDLKMGGNETILYADLVAETARQVKVTHLKPQNIYEVTCDSWSAQFAATFCNELTASLVDQPSAAISSQEGIEPARIVDAASQAGSLIYPHWYLQGLAGLAGGCLVGVLLGFVKRPASKPVEGNNLPAQ